MKKIFLALNLMLLAAICYGSYLYQVEGGLLIKGATSGLFALLALVNLLYAVLQKRPLIFPTAMAAGALFSMGGDILLGESFLLGAGLFALGHLCYLAAYCFLIRPRIWDLAFCGVFFGAAAFLLHHPLLVFSRPEQKWICLAYALIITLMMGKAVANFIRRCSRLTTLLAVGSLLFAFSDVMLVFAWFIGVLPMASLLCMATYYPAQAMLAASGFFGAGELAQKKK